ncbi:alkaline phosphatase [Flavobacterium segetis]|uniref:Alkaline phosphatase n=1 Tax=Flavobacterium segetis TaxID=271157 RepID=A0A1M5H413_9FLAO|nr:alkaline phosphatase [Flavobacterium segetis]SHG10737.1 alkaline phosphatase [Flavobacterium segetis]
MNRRKFFKNGSLFAIGSTFLNPFEGIAKELDFDTLKKNKKAKNIIVIVSDGMSHGTLNMADLYLNRKTGQGSNWLQLYKDNKVSRALMDMSSASSIVTDSAAASSSWGSGFRVKNGSLNIGVNGEEYLPIWQKFKKAGKMAGCVTTVPITHATPAGFCIASKSRNSQDSIAEMYLDLKFDVMMGGGNNYFASDSRKDKRDLYQEFLSKGFAVVKNKKEMFSCDNSKPILGVFYNDGLPYSKDRESSKELIEAIPTLAEMTKCAIDKMKHHPNGFVLQVEAGKVDWAAHGNDIAGLLYDQVAHDEAVKIAIDFAEKDKNTLVIITTDHGNANPGIIYGKDANDNFDSIHNYRQTNEWILNGIGQETRVSQMIERIEYANKTIIKEDDAKEILNFYSNIKLEEGLYNPRHLPFKVLADIQKKYNSVGWISMDHSADYSELAMYGPGSDLLKPFIKNTDLHYLMLKAAEIENNF